MEKAPDGARRTVPPGHGSPGIPRYNVYQNSAGLHALSSRIEYLSLQSRKLLNIARVFSPPRIRPPRRTPRPEHGASTRTASAFPVMPAEAPCHRSRQSQGTTALTSRRSLRSCALCPLTDHMPLRARDRRPIQQCAQFSLQGRHMYPG